MVAVQGPKIDTSGLPSFLLICTCTSHVHTVVGSAQIPQLDLAGKCDADPCGYYPTVANRQSHKGFWSAANALQPREYSRQHMSLRYRSFRSTATYFHFMGNVRWKCVLSLNSHRWLVVLHQLPAGGATPCMAGQGTKGVILHRALL